MSPEVKALPTVVGMIFMMNSEVPPPDTWAAVWREAADRLGVQRFRIDVHADAGLEDVGQHEAEDQRDGRHAPRNRSAR